MSQDLEAQSLGRPYLLEDDQMLMPEEVSAMLRLKELGWGVKRIAREFGISKNTAKRYLRAGGYSAYRQPQRAKALDGLEEWLKEQFLKHAGNADVVRQQLEARGPLSPAASRRGRRLGSGRGSGQARASGTSGAK